MIYTLNAEVEDLYSDNRGVVIEIRDFDGVQNIKIAWENEHGYGRWYESDDDSIALA